MSTKQATLSNPIFIIPDGNVRDYIDGKIRKETPEEYVRQTVEKRLVIEHKYPKSCIAVEYMVKMGNGKKRADIVIFPKNSTTEDFKNQHNIQIIVECKKESIKPTDSKEGIAQLKTYMAACSNCKWGMWTNGKYKTCYKKTIDAEGKIVFDECNDIPSAGGMTNENERPKRTTLTKATDDNLLFTFRTCHNVIYVNDGYQKAEAFFELLKIIFCKIQDERNLFSPVEFYTTSTERNFPDGQITVYNRISKIFEEVKRRNSRIFDDTNDTIKLEPRTVAQIVGELQKYSLLNTNIDYKGKAYEEIVGANLRGDRGEFFTPRNVMHMAVDMINPQKDEKILDSSCGTGGFIVTAMNAVISKLTTELESRYGTKDCWDINTQQLFNTEIAKIASENFFGFDINPSLVKATKMNMVMNNDGSGNIIQLNTLLPPAMWAESKKKQLAEALGVCVDTILNYKTIGLFDVIVTNPPFGTKIPIDDQQILEQFELAHIWSNIPGKGWQQTASLRSSVPPEQLFIERIIQLLKPGGRAAIVLPDSILSSPGLEFIRVWLLRNTHIIASIDLHADTFQPHNGTQCSILFVVKKTKEEMDEERTLNKTIDYDVFMAMIDHIGHDKRGNTIYKRDDEGNLIMEHREEIVKDTDVNGNIVYRKEAFDEKIINDQTVLVATVFANWKKEQGIIW